MADNNPYVVGTSPNYASPLFNLFGNNSPQQGQQQGQAQGQQPQGGQGQPNQQNPIAPALGKLLSQIFKLGPMQVQGAPGAPLDLSPGGGAVGLPTGNATGGLY